MQIEVRDGTPGDIDWLLNQLRDFSDFFKSERPLFPEREYAEQYMMSLIRDHVVLVATRPTEAVPSIHLPLGFIAGTLVQHPYNQDITMLSESFWWVDPKYRGSRAGALLFASFMERGKVLVGSGGWITMSLETNSPVNPNVLTKRGFREQETAYVMEVK